MLSPSQQNKRSIPASPTRPRVPSRSFPATARPQKTWVEGGEMLQPGSVWQLQELIPAWIRPHPSPPPTPALTSRRSHPAPRGWAQSRGGGVLCPARCSRRSPKRSGALHEKLGVNVKLINWERCMHCHKKPSVSPRRPSSHLRSPRSRAPAKATAGGGEGPLDTPDGQYFFLPWKAPHGGNREKHKAGMEKLGKTSPAAAAPPSAHVLRHRLQGHGRGGTSIFCRGQGDTAGGKNRGMSPFLPVRHSVASPVLQDKSFSGSSSGVLCQRSLVQVLNQSGGDAEGRRMLRDAEGC